MESSIAHVKEEREEWYEHTLEEHLLEVAKLAKMYLGQESSEWLELAGKWHDLGKYNPKWQVYLKDKSGYQPNAHIEAQDRPNHSTAGAIHAVRVLGDGVGHILAYIIAGHHAGLADWNTAESSKGSLRHRLNTSENEYFSSLKASVSEDILQHTIPVLPNFVKDIQCLSLWMRMLFSSLVDADFLDTEYFFNSYQSKQRSQYPKISELSSNFNTAYSKLTENASETSLNRVRGDIYNSCLKAAELAPGIFSLTVPTGGGKTLSSLAFALKHATHHAKDRIIYGIPFTSIIEQNAKVFKEFLGENSVLEHHSSIEVTEGKEDRFSRLASENWDAPLIVTTNVQLFESLHSSKTSRCRKLHNLRNSVIILDEAQQLPRDFHKPITQVMQQLSDHFGVTWVLCTATQPDFSPQTDAFGKTLLEGLSHIREIVDRPSELAQKLKRVNVDLPSNDSPVTKWEELASEVGELDSVLVIVNTRRHAKTLFDLLPTNTGNYYLSANMCAEHRTEVISEIKQLLQLKRQGNNQPLRVISTQLIEAGVDVDFPVVYRAMAGLDSIAQSAGRCNREGKIQNHGKVIVFKPEERSPIGFLRQGEDTTLALIASGKLNDPLSPESLHAYFSLMNEKGDRDKHNIVDLLTPKMSKDSPLDISFRSASEKFKLIDNNGAPIIVPYIKTDQKKDDESQVYGWLDHLERDPQNNKWVYRKLQRYTVTLPEMFIEQLNKAGCLEQRAGLSVLLDVHYSEKWGVETPDALIDAEKYII
ncbi:CRISPR-associated helicase Cas3' [Leucothrix pacifica]|uniref:CRISPR-associated helicase/endonuclease Cas3 n=1 Tax=Leucothrix pacifica TaxID=1247513 RepID=A0A317C9M5_9GAMM|nr:CRISPR-associated helicase Cas3' [Leucothrix pacifica]PWQ94023.1 CRISPR-associated helicase/endonuclease Cas3 [Leucothrix pacifica]